MNRMKSINKTTIYIAIGTLAFGLLLGWVLFNGSPNSEVSEHQHDNIKNEVWTCSMHPQIRQAEPGQCPICGMDLIPLNNGSDGGDNPMEIKMSPTAMQLANVRTSIIKKQKPEKLVRINGKVRADERRIFSQSSHIPGRIERLLVSFTGEQVKKGQVLAYVYSPELVMAQEELFEAHKIKEQQPELFNAAVGKLRNWKLTKDQIDGILLRGIVQEQFPVLADVTGVVLQKKVNLGDYVNRGESLYELADLSSVWVQFDLYESDLPWVGVGDQLKFTVQSLPGQNFQGRISFIDPIINPSTRVAQARIELPNHGVRLKPDMFALGTVMSRLKQSKKQLIVPKSAIMWTGVRSVVYVKQSSKIDIGFAMREVVLGPALGDGYVIVEGLEEGEEIATNGTFSIDAAAQLAGKPSMMNPNGGQQMSGHQHGSQSSKTSKQTNKSFEVTQDMRATLMPLISNYLGLKEALAKDNLPRAKTAGSSLSQDIKKVKMTLFKDEAHSKWMSMRKRALVAVSQIEDQDDINEVRKDFVSLSNTFIEILEEFGPFEDTLYLLHCPMADQNKGAFWLSSSKEVVNPYFGKDMLTCGSLKGQYPQ